MNNDFQKKKNKEIKQMINVSHSFAFLILCLQQKTGSSLTESNNINTKFCKNTAQKTGICTSRFSLYSQTHLAQLRGKHCFVTALSARSARFSNHLFQNLLKAYWRPSTSGGMQRCRRDRKCKIKQINKIKFLSSASKLWEIGMQINILLC